MAKLTQDIRRAYGDVTSPNYEFASKRFHGLEMVHLLSQIVEAQFTCTETTDLNYDVSRRFFLERGGETTSLDLSLVSTYAFVWPSGVVDFPIAQPNNSTSIDRELHILVVGAGWKVLEPLDLDALIEFGPNRKRVPVYGVLFDSIVLDS